MRTFKHGGHEFVAIEPTMIAAAIAFAYGMAPPRAIIIAKANLNPAAVHVTSDQEEIDHGNYQENHS